jgi:kynurenine formamidase
MPFVSDPYSSLQFLELSHVWGHGAPSYPGQADVKMHRAVKHAEHGVLAWRVNTVLHTGTHMNAPINMLQRGADLSEIPVDRFFGNGVVLSIPKGPYEVVAAADLEAAAPGVREGDIVVIVTGWHKQYSDSLEYFGQCPGLSKDAAEWLVKKNCKMVAVDTQQVDHPMATSLGPHRGGPTMKRLAGDYQRATGLDPKAEHGVWYVAHRTLLKAGIPTIEQVGGDVELLLGKRATFVATPWKIRNGDACPVRFVAMIDPTGQCRIDSGRN